MDKPLPQMVIPKKVIIFNPNTAKRETWTWIQFQKHIEEYTKMFMDAGINPEELNEETYEEITEQERTPRKTYDH